MGCLRGCHSCGFDLAGSIESKLSDTAEALLRMLLLFVGVVEMICDNVTKRLLKFSFPIRYKIAVLNFF